MLPRTLLARISQCVRVSLSAKSLPSLRTIPFSLFAALSTQSRSAHILTQLSDNRGAYSKRIRKGRGPSSGKGKTAGRGHKGSGQRHGINPWFQGGQTPLIVSKGRKGFENLRAPQMAELNLDKLQMWIDTGRIDPTRQITPREIIKSGLCGRTIKDGIKILARGKTILHSKIDIVASRASAQAIEAIEAAGGRVTTRYYTKTALKRLVNGTTIHTTKPLPVGEQYVEREIRKSQLYPGVYRLPDPTSRTDIEYYRDPAHRGYLSHTLKPGESPSLYYKVPNEKRIVTLTNEVVQKKRVANDKLW